MRFWKKRPFFCRNNDHGLIGRRNIHQLNRTLKNKFNDANSSDFSVGEGDFFPDLGETGQEQTKEKNKTPDQSLVGRFFSRGFSDRIL